MKSFSSSSDAVVIQGSACVKIPVTRNNLVTKVRRHTLNGELVEGLDVILVSVWLQRRNRDYTQFILLSVCIIEWLHIGIQCQTSKFLTPFSSFFCSQLITIHFLRIYIFHGLVVEGETYASPKTEDEIELR